MQRTWPPTVTGSHYSPTRENVQLGAIEAEKEQGDHSGTADSEQMRDKSNRPNRTGDREGGKERGTQ